MALTVDSKEELENKKNDLIEEGWKVKTDAHHKVVMERYSYGSGLAHFLIFLFLGWWTVGLANLLYAGFKRYSTSRKRVIRMNE
ncbi:MAG: hypothetical protein ACLFQ8_00440 [Candidatus Aenigmatarchaeota archaeon]